MSEALKKISTFTFNTMALLFTLLFLFTGLLIFSVPMTGVLDFSFFPAIVGISTFVMAIILSIFILHSTFGKVLLAIDIALMLALIFLGP